MFSSHVKSYHAILVTYVTQYTGCVRHFAGEHAGDLLITLLIYATSYRYVKIILHVHFEPARYSWKYEIIIANAVDFGELVNWILVGSFT